MPEYTQRQFREMQQDAVNRVLEMQRRARNAAANGGIRTPDTTPKNPPETVEATPHVSFLGNNFNIDSDVLIILGLAYLLLKENNDPLLLLALLYILL